MTKYDDYLDQLKKYSPAVNYKEQFSFILERKQKKETPVPLLLKLSASALVISVGMWMFFAQINFYQASDNGENEIISYVMVDDQSTGNVVLDYVFLSP